MSIAGTLAPQESGSKARPRMSVFLLLVVVVGACLYLVPRALLAYGVIGVLAVLLLCCLTAMVLRGDPQPLLLGWVLLFPLGYYFLSFPRERPIFTLDRGLVAGLIVAMCFALPEKTTGVSREMRRAALAWVFFVIAVFFSFQNLGSLFSPFRVLFDSFVLPALLGWYVIRNFPVRRRVRTFHILVSIAAIYLAAIGAAEMVLGQDLLPLPGAGLSFAGFGNLVLRPNGPFLTNHSFGLIGLISFCFLLFLRRVIGKALPSWERLLHAFAVACAAAVALMPFFRSIVLTLLIILLLEGYFSRSRGRRLVLVSLVICAIGIFTVVKMALPELYEERVEAPVNLYARIAQQLQTYRIFLEHPVFGVGFLNYAPAAEKSTGNVPYFEDVEAVYSPHNNLGEVLAETGLLGFLPYVTAQILFLRAFWKLRGRGSKDWRLVWLFFLYIFLSYWISGMSLTSGYYSDLNLWYVFTTACLYKYCLAEPRGASAAPSAAFRNLCSIPWVSIRDKGDCVAPNRIHTRLGGSRGGHQGGPGAAAVLRAS